MGLRGQFAQGHLRMLQRITLRTEGCIAQTRAAINTLETITAIATVCAIAKTITGPSALIRRTTITSAFTAVAKLATSARRRQFGFLLARSVVTTHSHHRPGRFQGRDWGRRLLRRLGRLGLLGLLGRFSRINAVFETSSRLLRVRSCLAWRGNDRFRFRQRRNIWG